MKIKVRCIHDLKVWEQFFGALEDGSKNFEVRKDDRGFEVGDALRLREYIFADGKYTGAEVLRLITYKLDGDQWGILKGYCVLGLSPIPFEIDQ